jgi:hypothetical protein
MWIPFLEERMINILEIRYILPNEPPLPSKIFCSRQFFSERAERLPRDIIKVPKIGVYIHAFGKKKDDHCLVADWNGKISAR